jgi:hypothetical protein
MTIAAASGFAKGFIQTPYPGAAGKVPVLSSFYFGYGVGGRPFDNHLAVLSVLPGGPSADLTPGADLSPSQVAPGTVDLDFQDSDPDRYFYRSEHVLLDASVATRFQLRDVGGVGSERSALPQNVDPPATTRGDPGHAGACRLPILLHGQPRPPHRPDRRDAGG